VRWGVVSEADLLPKVASSDDRHARIFTSRRCRAERVKARGITANRGTGQDFPRIAVNAPLGKVLVVWNDASAHPLGDIWLRALPRNLTITGPIS
jgi:hypothetical protein